jgi:hypothetical protein
MVVIIKIGYVKQNMKNIGSRVPHREGHSAEPPKKTKKSYFF